jgi:hypothetical protein
MRNRGLIAVVLGIGVPLIAPGAARADDVTLNVPVQINNMASNVTRGRVECLVQAGYTGSGGARSGGSAQARRDVDPFEARGTSSEFTLDANGGYSGTQTVRVQTPPPRQLWIDEGRTITFLQPVYSCHVQVATPSSDWYPSLQAAPRDMATGQATGRRAEGEAPAWARSTGGRPIVSGNLRNPTPGAR